jgi:hypothetical protein
MTPDTASSSPPPSRPWWREPMMWLVVGGPAVVVAAGIVTAMLAVARPDPVVVENAYRRGLEFGKGQPAEALQPAVAARNHAATGGNRP